MVESAAWVGLTRDEKEDPEEHEKTIRPEKSVGEEERKEEFSCILQHHPSGGGRSLEGGYHVCCHRLCQCDFPVRLSFSSHISYNKKTLKRTHKSYN